MSVRDLPYLLPLYRAEQRALTTPIHMKILVFSLSPVLALVLLFGRVAITIAKILQEFREHFQSFHKQLSASRMIRQHWGLQSEKELESHRRKPGQEAVFCCLRLLRMWSGNLCLLLSSISRPTSFWMNTATFGSQTSAWPATSPRRSPTLACKCKCLTLSNVYFSGGRRPIRDVLSAALSLWWF